MRKSVEKTMDIELSVENTPFVFNYDYYRIGRTYLHIGEFLHPNFGLYSYPKSDNKIPVGWRDCFTDRVHKNERSIRNFFGYLTPEDLFENLDTSKLEFARSIDNIDVNELLEFVQDNINFNYEFTPICDGGYESTNVYIYIKELNLYRRFTLKHTGEFTINHNSEKINKLLSEIGFSKRHTW